jgi:hypothetical protein
MTLVSPWKVMMHPLCFASKDFIEVGGGLPSVIRSGGDPSIKSLLPPAVKVFFVFPFSVQQAGLGENKKSLALRAQGFY